MSTFKDIDNTGEFLRQLNQLTTSKVQGGIFSGGNFDGVLRYAISNEFGAKIPVSEGMRKVFAKAGFPLKKETKFFIIPERAAIRKAFDNDANIDRAIDIGVKSFNKTTNANSMISAMGASMISFIQASIASNIGPENHPFTILKKGGKNKTLINHGNYRQSITFKTA